MTCLTVTCCLCTTGALSFQAAAHLLGSTQCISDATFNMPSASPLMLAQLGCMAGMLAPLIAAAVAAGVLQVMMQLDAQGLQAQQTAETARREAGKLGMKVLQQQMQVRSSSKTAVRPCMTHTMNTLPGCTAYCPA